MPCGALFTTPRISISALNTVRGAEYYANYTAKYGGGSACGGRTNAGGNATPPASVQPHPVMQQGLKDAFNASQSTCVSREALKSVLTSCGVSSVEKNSPVAAALSQAVDQGWFLDGALKKQVLKIAAGDNAELAKVLA
jgi:hypothetical protein